MIKTGWPITKKERNILLSISFALVIYLTGCGGGGGSPSASDDSNDDDPPLPATWTGNQVLQLTSGGLLTPRIQAFQEDEDQMGLLYFEDAQSGGGEYDLKKIVFQSAGAQAGAVMVDEHIVTIDNCKTLATARNVNGDYIVAYQGGEVKDCGGEEQADAMFSMESNGTWEEYTGAIGEVERNPVFHDGLAGGDMSLVNDSSGNIHLCFQFYYEGCDTMNANYPDLNYVKKRAGDPSAYVAEEQVEGNTYYTGGGIQNNVGHHCKMILDQDENPVIFYYAELPGGLKGLRMARKINNVWVKSWVESGIEVGAIACARDENGNLGVAYYVVNYEDPSTNEVSPACLRYAQNSLSQFTTWTCRMVDDTTLCGKFPSLAFNPSGQPGIAYFEEETYSGYSLQNLKLAIYNGQSWGLETAASTGNIGYYNNLWFGEDDTPFISTYSESEKKIYLFHKS
ncbi:MAG: hypothetical protein FP814_12640 [Desulfobacterium sp.]|nr:hypothetical protein [Desulfobacteraceae bacterium]MBA3037326.1 hypothetical protein [Desulfobacterium sp.]MBU4037289.1 hypothetical protein [Pseudomonadota bacterium]